jgi:hypothetical protein
MYHNNVTNLTHFHYHYHNISVSISLLEPTLFGVRMFIERLCHRWRLRSYNPLYIALTTLTVPFFWKFRNPHWNPVCFGLRILCISVSEPSERSFHIGYWIVIASFGLRTPTALLLQGFRISCNMCFGLSFAVRKLRSSVSCPNKRNPCRCKGRADWPINLLVSGTWNALYFTWKQKWKRAYSHTFWNCWV